ncbi:RidA family protein [Streptomyces sp. NPDC020096]
MSGVRASSDETHGGLERINPPQLSPNTGFSHAVRAAGGTLVFLAGQTALSTQGAIVGDGIVEQFELALANLLTALRASGGEPGQLAKLTVYAVDIEDYRAHAADIGRVWHRLVGRDYPAMAVIGVSRLWDREALVELEAMAVLP